MVSSLLAEMVPSAPVTVTITFLWQRPISCVKIAHMQSPQVPLPTWLSWSLVFGGIITTVVAWVSFGLTLRREIRDRPKLKFRFDPCLVEAGDDDSGTRLGPDGSSLVDAVSVAVTNLGLRVITIHHCEWAYSCVPSGGEARIIERMALMDNPKIGLGEACSTYLVMPVMPRELKFVKAVDSTGKEWGVSTKELAALQIRLVDWWDKSVLPLKQLPASKPQ
jgi:hypothetical protein